MVVNPNMDLPSTVRLLDQLRYGNLNSRCGFVRLAGAPTSRFRREVTLNGEFPESALILMSRTLPARQADLRPAP